MPTKRELLLLYVLTVTGLLLIDFALFIYFQTDKLSTGYLVYPYRDAQYFLLFFGVVVLLVGAFYIFTRKDSKP